MKMTKLTPEMKLRRWNKVLLAKCIRIGDMETAEWFQKQIPSYPTPPVNIRAFAKVYGSLRHATEFGYEMASMLDGSGECGKFIYGNYEKEMNDNIEKACRLIGADFEEVYNAAMDMRNVIYNLRYNYIFEIGNYIHLPLGFDNQEQMWQELSSDLERSLHFEDSEVNSIQS